jgi:hypothetical protein
VTCSVYGQAKRLQTYPSLRGLLHCWHSWCCTRPEQATAVEVVTLSSWAPLNASILYAVFAWLCIGTVYKLNVYTYGKTRDAANFGLEFSNCLQPGLEERGDATSFLLYSNLGSCASAILNNLKGGCEDVCKWFDLYQNDSKNIKNDYQQVTLFGSLSRSSREQNRWVLSCQHWSWYYQGSALLYHHLLKVTVQ